MKSNVYSIVYCSRNRIHGEPAEIKNELECILGKSRKNNAVVGVTGALLYSAGSFAQVLEGSLDAIERTFEKIQRDERHGEVTVIQSGLIEERQFPEWSMGFAGGSSLDSTPAATAAFNAVFAHSAGGKEEVLSMMRNLVVEDIDWVLQNTA